MSMKERERLKVLSRVENTELKLEDAAAILGICYRQARASAYPAGRTYYPRALRGAKQFVDLGGYRIVSYLSLPQIAGIAARCKDDGEGQIAVPVL